MPASARLATVATVIGSHLSQWRGTPQRPDGLLLRLLELAYALFQCGELGLRLLEQLSLDLKVLAQYDIHAVEPAGEERSQVLLDVLRRGVAKRLVDARAQVVEQCLFHRFDLSTGVGRTKRGRGARRRALM